MGVLGRRQVPAARSAVRSLRVAGLFAGVGGLERGFELAGHRTAMLCEIDDGADAVLAVRFAGVRRHRDVREIDSLPRSVDLVAAGFPCQNLSPAGDTLGIEGPKSALVGAVFGLLRERAVPWVVLENVPFMLHLDRGRAMRHVVEELESLGYRWAYRVVDSMAFGLPQRRRRVFVVATRTKVDPESVLFSDDVPRLVSKEWSVDRSVGFYWTEGNRGVGWAVDSVPTLKGGSGIGIPSAPAVLLPGGRVVTPSIEGAERLQGFSAGWTSPAEDVVSGRMRWRMVGNAVNVRAAEWLGRRLATPGVFDERRLGAVLTPRSAWPIAACNRGGVRQAVSIGEWPCLRRLEPIFGFVRDGKPLSRRATAGFVSRAERAEREGCLSFQPQFLERLRQHLDSVQDAAAAAAS